MLFHNKLRGTMQIAASGVVPEAAPVREHLFLAGGRECSNSWKRGYETLVIGDYSDNLRLLQHDFGQPDMVGIRILPRQIVAAMVLVPCDKE